MQKPLGVHTIMEHKNRIPKGKLPAIQLDRTLNKQLTIRVCYSHQT